MRTSVWLSDQNGGACGWAAHKSRLLTGHCNNRDVWQNLIRVIGHKVSYPPANDESDTC
jgi:hypothetical protein